MCIHKYRVHFRVYVINNIALTVIMESGTKTTYNNIPAGTFMPISALTICDIDAAGEEPPSPSELKPYISVLF